MRLMFHESWLALPYQLPWCPRLRGGAKSANRIWRGCFRTKLSASLRAEPRHMVVRRLFAVDTTSSNCRSWPPSSRLFSRGCRLYRIL